MRQAAAALLDSEHDLEGMAQVWLTVGKARFFAVDALGAEEALGAGRALRGKAATIARS